MKVKCIDNFNEKLDLTVGQEYDVYSTGEINGKTFSYTVKNDSGLLCAYGVILFELVEGTKLQCDSGCAHAQVCGHKEQWANYCKEHIKLREKSVLFDEEPKCRYYIHESRLKEESTIKANKDDLVEKIKRSNVIKKEDKECRNPYRDDYGWHFDNDKRKAYEELARPYKKDENIKGRKLTDEELIKVVERFLGL